MKPQGIQLSRAAGFQLQAFSLALNGLPAVKVDRSTKWGNPFVGDAAACVEAFEALRRGYCNVEVGPDRPIKRMAWIPAYVGPDPEELRGKNLACWCALDAPCHRHVWLRLANG